jgi:hypothetical protein
MKADNIVGVFRELLASIAGDEVGEHEIETFTKIFALFITNPREVIKKFEPWLKEREKNSRIVEEIRRRNNVGIDDGSIETAPLRPNAPIVNHPAAATPKRNADEAQDSWNTLPAKAPRPPQRKK